MLLARPGSWQLLQRLQAALTGPVQGHLAKRSACRLQSTTTAGRPGVATTSGKDWDVVVVGGGVMGSWAAAQVAARGASCCLLDQFQPGHENGSSHGDGRIYRFAYTEDIYVDMMALSLQHWHTLQDFAGEELLVQTGGLSIAEKATRGTGGDCLTPLEALYRRRGLAYEHLTAEGVTNRFPQYVLPETMEALLLPEMGVLFATKCVQATWRLAQSRGCQVRTGARVVRVAEDSGMVIVQTEEGEEVRARAAVVAPGAWLSSMAKALFDLEVPTRVTAETVSYYAPLPECGLDHSLRSMPVFVSYKDNELGAFGYYGLPSIDIPGVKVSAHFCGPVVDPCVRPRAAGGSGATAELEAETDQRIQDVIASNGRIVATQFPHLESKPFLSQNCLYTCTADHDYIIDRLPGLSSIVLAGGGSGHAFKMGPAIGEACACLALNEPLPFQLEKFSVARLLSQGSSHPSTVAFLRK